MLEEDLKWNLILWSGQWKGKQDPYDMVVVLVRASFIICSVKGVAPSPDFASQ
jgi:hypothetical protein